MRLIMSLVYLNVCWHSEFVYRKNINNLKEENDELRQSLEIQKERNNLLQSQLEESQSHYDMLSLKFQQVKCKMNLSIVWKKSSNVWSAVFCSWELKRAMTRRIIAPLVTNANCGSTNVPNSMNASKQWYLKENIRMTSIVNMWTIWKRKCSEQVQRFVYHNLWCEQGVKP